MPGCTQSTRRPEQTPLYRLLQKHLASFLAAVEQRDDRSLPRFVIAKLEAFLRCGILAHGFARFRCPACRHEHLNAHSCKARGLCPSCDGRRMTQLASHITDSVIPVVPTRQWVFTVPHPLRYRIAYDHRVLPMVHRIVVRALRGDHRRRARETGLPPGQTGLVTFIQRFGSALNLNVHFHIQVIDGVFHRDAEGDLHFHQLAVPQPQDMDALVLRIQARIERMLRREGLLDDDCAADPLSDAHPQLAACYAGAIRNRSALTRPGCNIPTIGTDPDLMVEPFTRKGCHEHSQGYDLHADLAIPARDRKRLQRVLRYAARPVVAHSRLAELSDGRYALELKTPWRDRTTHLVFQPHEVIERLAALIPKPNKNLVVYSGVLAPNHKWRKQVIAYRCGEVQARPAPLGPNPSWADLMRCAFDANPLACPTCGAQMRFIANIRDRATIVRILAHLGLPTDPPPQHPARPPLQTEFDFDHVA